MSSHVESGFKAISKFKLWIRLKNQEILKLSDFPEIIPLRWTYFRDNWEFLKQERLIPAISNYSYPDILNKNIDDLSRFIEIQRNSTNKSVNPFNKSDILNKYYGVWDILNVADIQLTKAELDIVEHKVNEISGYIRTDFLEIRRQLRETRDSIADTVGLSDSDYDIALDRRSQQALRSAKTSDIEKMQIFHAMILELDKILANIFSLETTSIDPFALARANANNPDITINTGNAGTFVTMEFGENLQSLAAKHLGDSDRWTEIAIANGLKPPYVDEIGQFIPLLSNGSGSQINLSSIDGSGNLNSEKIYIGQPVFLSSDQLRFPEQREIINITIIPISNEIVLELSGENDLDKFRIDESAGIRVYTPNTINSNFMILIPQQQTTDSLPSSQQPFFLQSKKEDEKKAGVDLFLTDNLDLSLTSSNDLQLSYGIGNAAQAMKLKMISEQGQLFRHPSFGLPSTIGESSADPGTLQNIIVNGVSRAVESDDRFQRLESLSVRLSEDAETKAFVVQLVVRMAGTDSLVPISFAVKAG